MTTFLAFNICDLSSEMIAIMQSAKLGMGMTVLSLAESWLQHSLPKPRCLRFSW